MQLEDITQAHREGAYKSFFEEVSGSPASWYLAEENDEDVFIHQKAGSGSCHANLRIQLTDTISRPIAIVVGSDPSFSNQEGVVEFYRWIIQDSIFSDAFVDKDPVLNIVNGFLLNPDTLRGDLTLPLLQILRLTTSEFKQNLVAIGKIIEFKSELPYLTIMTLVCCFGLFIDKNMIKIRNLRLGYFYAGSLNHLPIPSDISVSDLLKPSYEEPFKNYGNENWKRYAFPVSQLRNYLNVNSNRIFFHNGNDREKILGNLNLAKKFLGWFKEGTPTLFTHSKVVKDENYKSLWSLATDSFKSETVLKGPEGKAGALNWFNFENNLIEEMKAYEKV